MINCIYASPQYDSNHPGPSASLEPREETDQHPRQPQYLIAQSSEKPRHCYFELHSSGLLLYLLGFCQFFIGVFDVFVGGLQVLIYFFEVVALLLDHHLYLFHDVLVLQHALVYLLVLLGFYLYFGGPNFVENDRFCCHFGDLSLAQRLPLPSIPAVICKISALQSASADIFFSFGLQFSFDIFAFFEHILNLSSSFGVRRMLIFIHNF